MTKSKETKIEIKIEPLNVKTLMVELVGKTPLVMDRFPDATKKQILGKQTGISKSNKKQIRDVEKEVVEAIHVTRTGKIGFPSIAFKKGMQEVTSFVGDKFFSKKLVSGAIRIINVEDGLIPIKCKKQTILEHSIGCNTKFNPQFHDWSCKLNIQYDANNISAEDIITVLNYAGYYVGVGIMRPKGKDGGTGEYGCYEVKTKK